ncbi:MAG TPA: TolC family protein, partial [Gemmatimonadaceae bacterium]|nr:TolC family protein [Gemmatimonadaceae bacterium]
MSTFPGPRATIAILAMAGGAALATAAGAQGRPLSLADAIAIADRRAYANRNATAAADAARGDAAGAWRGVLPSIGTEASVARTTDPIGAFGYQLQQRAVTPAAFAPDALNYPAGVTNYGAALVVAQPLVNADAWMGMRAARAAADASAAAARWTATSVRADVVQAYYGAIVAREMARAMAAAERAALEHVRAAEAAATNGFA